MCPTAFVSLAGFQPPQKWTQDGKKVGRRPRSAASPALVSHFPSSSQPQIPRSKSFSARNSDELVHMAQADRLLLRLHAAIDRQDFSEAAKLRDEIEKSRLHDLADFAKPLYSPGLVVTCRVKLGNKEDRLRAIVLSVNMERTCEKSTRMPQVWYRCAADVEDCARIGIRGANVLPFHQDALAPAVACPTERDSWGVNHPAVGVIFEYACGISEDGFQFYERSTRSRSVFIC